jgi:DNA-binding SARP family transcriptional activator
MLSLDPLSEEAQRSPMRFLAMNDDRAAAIAQFETCRHVLAEELGVDPSPETVRLTDQIRAGDLAPRRPEPRRDQAAAPGPAVPPPGRAVSWEPPWPTGR